MTTDGALDEQSYLMAMKEEIESALDAAPGGNNDINTPGDKLSPPALQDCDIAISKTKPQTAAVGIDLLMRNSAQDIHPDPVSNSKGFEDRISGRTDDCAGGIHSNASSSSSAPPSEASTSVSAWVGQEDSTGSSTSSSRQGGEDHGSSNVTASTTSIGASTTSSQAAERRRARARKMGLLQNRGEMLLSSSQRHLQEHPYQIKEDDGDREGLAGLACDSPPGSCSSSVTGMVTSRMRRDAEDMAAAVALTKKQLRMIRNRESAALSRKRKRDQVEALELEVEALKDKNRQLKQRLARYEGVDTLESARDAGGDIVRGTGATPAGLTWQQQQEQRIMEAQQQAGAADSQDPNPFLEESDLDGFYQPLAGMLGFDPSSLNISLPSSLPPSARQSRPTPSSGAPPQTEAGRIGGSKGPGDQSGGRKGPVTAESPTPTYARLSASEIGFAQRPQLSMVSSPAQSQEPEQRLRGQQLQQQHQLALEQQRQQQQQVQKTSIWEPAALMPLMDSTSDFYFGEGVEGVKFGSEQGVQGASAPGLVSKEQNKDPVEEEAEYSRLPEQGMDASDPGFARGRGQRKSPPDQIATGPASTSSLEGDRRPRQCTSKTDRKRGRATATAGRDGNADGGARQASRTRPGSSEVEHLDSEVWEFPEYAPVETGGSLSLGRGGEGGRGEGGSLISMRLGMVRPGAGGAAYPQELPLEKDGTEAGALERGPEEGAGVRRRGENLRVWEREGGGREEGAEGASLGPSWSTQSPW
ncbi:activating transcription factor 6 [Nannochloropsis gaditana CCMP526]|uniref:activating transcription factor 6 n=1 Tax=Nannochloropsis gaditana (strain CCMP526) TaxID=1093141 RepID=UPI00029F78E9|nr:activating transcription factor 6 [Nannochloropsis gaditana CCMP526]EKU22876.1 activating transcription factor 6 [Nannochloropsis gaditana CCMP526]|eukprot:XP_005853482.1 activating transcription factor 6 [Nannochloropsis gaditana CCMP526]